MEVQFCLVCLKLLEEPENPQTQTLPLDNQEQPWKQRGRAGEKKHSLKSRYFQRIRKE